MKQEKSSLLQNKRLPVPAGIPAVHRAGPVPRLPRAAAHQPRWRGRGHSAPLSRTSCTYNRQRLAGCKYLGNTLVKTAPLLMCALSILFAYKVGLFNIGAAGQYVHRRGAEPVRGAGPRAGAGCRACCSPLLRRRGAGRHLRACSSPTATSTRSSPASCSTGSCLYLTNMLSSPGEGGQPAPTPTGPEQHQSPTAVLPSLGLGALFNNNQYVDHRHPAGGARWPSSCGSCWRRPSSAMSCEATGCNKFAAKYCGMEEKRNIILSHGHRRRPCRHGRGHAVPHRISSSGSAHAVLRAGHGLQRHRRRLPGRTESHRRYLLLVSSFSTSPTAARMWTRPCTARRSPI